MSKPALLVTLAMLGLSAGAFFSFRNTSFQPLEDIQAEKILVRKLQTQGALGEPTPDIDKGSIGNLKTSSLSLMRCSSVLVGSQVLLTSGHCVDNSQRIHALRANGTCYEPEPEKDKTCTGNAARAHPDIAVCFLDTPVLAPRYQTISASLPATGSAITARGLGASQPRGPATAISVDARAVLKDIASPCLTGKTEEKSAVCNGDSGGGVFDASGQLIGIISDADCKEKGILRAAILAAALDFIKNHPHRGAEHKICGIDSTDPNCFKPL